jgi:hypothetical protein
MEVCSLIYQLFRETNFCSCLGSCFVEGSDRVKSTEAVERSCITELEEANAQLRAELDEARPGIVEVEGRKNVLKSNYGGLRSDYGNLETILMELQQVKTKADKVHHDKFQKFHAHFSHEAA